MDKQLQSPKQQVLAQQPRKNYGGQYQSGGHQIKCYTKKQMKSLYPGKDFKVLAEHAVGSRKQQIGILESGKRRPLYRYGTHSRLLYREYGFTAVDEDSYVALLKNALLPRVAVLAACLAVIAGAVFATMYLGKGQEVASVPEESVAAAGNPQPELEEGAVDWQGVKPQDTGGVVPGIAIPGYKSITVDANTKDVKVNLQNPEGNPCYFEISLLLSDGTELYKSKMIEPGKGLYNISLSKTLDAGEYDAVVKYDTFSLSDLSPMNGAQVQIKLIAQ